MSVYKVLQDIEGEDKLILWLTPKQTLYAAAVFIFAGIAYLTSRANVFLAVPWLIPILFFGFLAAPLGRDQPNDVWLAAQIRFYLKNRKRIWDQSGMEELVHITVPKKVEKVYTDGLDQTEVKSRLQALSATIDSRGWAVKNANVNLTASPQFSAQFQQASEDRLIGTEAIAFDTPVSDVSASDDILDADNNSIAQRFDEQIKKQEELHKKALRESVNRAAQGPQAQGSSLPDDYYFLREQAVAQTPSALQLATFGAQVVAPGTELVQDPFAINQAVATTATPDDTDAEAQAFLDKLHHNKEITDNIAAHSHQTVIQTPEEIAEEQRKIALKNAELKRIADEQKRIAEEAERKRIEHERIMRRQATQTAPDAIIKELSRDSELKVSTLASQAKRAVETKDDGEVVVSLH